MAEDREVLREIWDSKIPVGFTLSQDEVFTLNIPETYYLMVPRLLYFPLVTDKVRRHFVQFINPEVTSNEMWLEFNGQPIKWNHPIGLWHDLLNTDGTLPWSITVHFDNYPEDKICRCPNKDAIRSQFMSVVKEADALKHKSNVINRMQEKDHSQLWTGFMNDKFDQFWSVNRKLMESPEGYFRNIPIRCYTGSKFAMQRLIRPMDDVGGWTTLKDALCAFFNNKIESDRVRVITHGIEPPLETPLQWMSEHLSYPDNFLHLVVLFE